MTIQYDKLTLEELQHETSIASNPLASALLTATLNITEQLEDIVSDQLATKLEESLNQEKEYYTNPESDRFEYLYYSECAIHEQSFDNYLESLELDEADVEFIAKFKEQIIDYLEENKDTCFTLEMYHNYYAPNSALICDSLGEIEIELDYHLKEIDFISDTIREQAFSKVSDWFIDDSRNYAYMDFSSDIVCLCINSDAISEAIAYCKEAYIQ